MTAFGVVIELSEVMRLHGLLQEVLSLQNKVSRGCCCGYARWFVAVKRSLVRVGVSARAAVQRDNLMIHRGENPRERKRPEKKRRAREVAVLGGMALGP
ncbi:hypothetical protein CRG98_001757 [Punica granatum]|uniref:Uncharacterized protein n=1 Tax=Punica granatum TaxID=22663 RepID=A0A2I0LB13_PUNGR|nr:hypothetical protein CRG98_001757 [Punica granatum]